MAYERDYIHYPLGPAPGVAVHAPILGHLDAYAADEHHTVLDDFVPHVVMRGTGVVQSRFGIAEVKAGDMFCMWPGEVYELGGDSDTPWELYWFHLRGTGAQSFIEGLGFRRDYCHVRPAKPAAVLKAAKRCVTLYQKGATSTPAQMSTALLSFVDLCGGAGPSGEASRDLVLEAQEIMQSSMGTGINVNEVCEILGVHRVTLARAFQTAGEESPLAYLTDLRLKRAAELLEHTAISVDDIAQAIGFSDGKYLMRRFRERYNMTPGQWRLKSQSD